MEEFLVYERIAGEQWNNTAYRFSSLSSAKEYAEYDKKEMMKMFSEKWEYRIVKLVEEEVEIL